MTDSLRQLKILQLCEEALDLAPTERDAWLAEKCDADEALIDDVQALLVRAESRDNPLPSNLLGGVEIGEQIGQYEVEQTIGHGGMGTVYRARRVDAPFEQSVALKLLRAQVVTESLRLRFDLERRVLARLSHPYIASLIDGGTTAKGMPWLVMELVDGVPIDQYCNEQRLTVDARLALLEKVALAVQHAHQNLVIHRDLKPSNVLVTADGIPKLVDFGIAKLIELPEEKQGGGLTTLFGQHALTPDFASPEQILEGRVSTASDIYSLGVLATLVLTGCKPYELDTKTPRSLLESFGRKTVPRASELVVRDRDKERIDALALERSISPARLRRLFQGDADTILATALHPDADKRYASADALRADLRRYRMGRPIAARADSLLSRTLGLIRVHKIAFGALAATLVALSFGLSIALWQARIAQKRFVDLHDFSQVVLGDIYDEVADLPGSTTARRDIVIAAQRYLDELAGSDATLTGRRLHNDVLLADLALSYKRLADVQGLPIHANLGESTLALENYRRALVIAQQVEDETDSNVMTRALIHQRLADVMAWQGEAQAAMQELQTSHALFGRLFAANPQDARVRMRMAYSHTNLGDLSGHPSHPNIGDASAAVAHYAQGLALFDDVDVGADEPELLRSLGVLLERSGTMAMVEEDIDAALEWYTRSADIRARLAAANTDHTDIQRDSGVAIEMIADVLKRSGDLSAALQKYREALAVYRRLFNIDSANANARRTLAIGLENLAEALVLDQSNERAIERYQEALTLREILVERDPDSPRLSKELDRTRTELRRLQAGFVSDASVQ